LARWEYRIIAFPSGWFRGVHSGVEPQYIPRAEAVLDALGREEWEVVGMTVADDLKATVLLKRSLLDVSVVAAAAVSAEEPEVVGAADAPVAIEEVERVLKEGG
jgi:hypothetical protein